MKYKNKAIKFAHDLVPLILDKTKTLTYRFGDKYDYLQREDTLFLEDSSNGEIFAEVKIINKTYTTFGDLPIDKKGHESYSSKEVQREKFKKYYAREMKDDDKILVLEFIVI